MIRSHDQSSALAAAATLLACSSAPRSSPAPAPTTWPPASATALITMRELDERWQKDDPAQHAEATQTLYDGRRAALDAIIADMLLADRRPRRPA